MSEDESPTAEDYARATATRLGLDPDKAVAYMKESHPMFPPLEVEDVEYDHYEDEPKHDWFETIVLMIIVAAAFVALVFGAAWYWDWGY